MFLTKLRQRLIYLTRMLNLDCLKYSTTRFTRLWKKRKNLGSQNRLIHVYHFTKEVAQNEMQVQNFGEPFFLIIYENETLEAVKVRIHRKLEVIDEEFSKRRDYGAWEQYLRLEHSDTTPKRSFTANQNRHTFEKAVKIYK